MLAQVPQLQAPPGYQTQAKDTGIETDLLVFYLLRHKKVQERLRMGAQLVRSARQFSINCLRRRFAHLSPPQLARKLAEAWLQEYCPDDYIPGGSEMTWIQDSIQLATELHPLLTELGIPYYVTGGVAAIAYGEPRTTQDLDVVIFLLQEDLKRLITALEQAGFYVAGVDDVLEGQMQTLQVTQIETISRADLIIVTQSSEYEQLKLQRRQSYPLLNGAEIYLASPEDLIISKLLWGHQSQSEKQWRDILGILKTQGEALDFQYLHQWACEFGLSEVLEQAAIAAGLQTMLIERSGAV